MCLVIRWVIGAMYGICIAGYTAVVKTRIFSVDFS